MEQKILKMILDCHDMGIFSDIMKHSGEVTKSKILGNRGRGKLRMTFIKETCKDASM